MLAGVRVEGAMWYICLKYLLNSYPDVPKNYVHSQDYSLVLTFTSFH